MNTLPVKVVTSEKKMSEAFRRESDIHSYKRISGNSRRGTYIVDVREGSESKRMIW